MRRNPSIVPRQEGSTAAKWLYTTNSRGCAGSTQSDRTDLVASASDWLAATSRHRTRVAGYIRRTTQRPSDVDELLAETWANAWCEYASGGTGTSEVQTLISHARRACTHWKAARRHEVGLPLSGLSILHSAESESDEQHIEAEWGRTFDWMRELPPQQFYALVFRLLRGSDFKMVAAAMGCSLSTAKTHYWRAIASLRRRKAQFDASGLNEM